MRKRIRNSILRDVAWVVVTFVGMQIISFLTEHTILDALSTAISMTCICLVIHLAEILGELVGEYRAKKSKNTLEKIKGYSLEELERRHCKITRNGGVNIYELKSSCMEEELVIIYRLMIYYDSKVLRCFSRFVNKPCLGLITDNGIMQISYSKIPEKEGFIKALIVSLCENYYNFKFMIIQNEMVNGKIYLEKIGALISGSELYHEVPNVPWLYLITSINPTYITAAKEDLKQYIKCKIFFERYKYENTHMLFVKFEDRHVSDEYKMATYGYYEALKQV